MTVRQVAEDLGLSVRAAESGLDAAVRGGIACDLLSVVMSQAAKGALWVTVQCHPNVVAVATLAGVSGIVIAHGFEPEPETLSKAEQERIPVLTTSASSFEVAGRLYGLGVR
ncbi:MAG: serine kinase [Armatimonadota bacterium]|nr:MAG: serine kinase [Armatimonadota bacterium]